MTTSFGMVGGVIGLNGLSTNITDNMVVYRIEKYREEKHKYGNGETFTYGWFNDFTFYHDSSLTSVWDVYERYKSHDSDGEYRLVKDTIGEVVKEG